jgi:prolyl 4-hydroxylase
LHRPWLRPEFGGLRQNAAMTSAQQPQHITEELRIWIAAQARAGCRREDVMAAMVASGWHEMAAQAAMEAVLLAPSAVQHAGSNAALAPARAVPEPAFDGKPSLTLADGHRVEWVSSLREPRVVVFGQLLSDAECDSLMALARPRLARSETVKNETGGSEVHAARTSDGMFFERGERPLIARIEARIAELLCWPVNQGEGLQILRYRPGAEYRPHFDFFDAQHPGTPRILERGGQRVGTLVIYLNTPEGGGSTIFPDAGLEVAPVRGNAVFFSYDRAHADTKTLHAGAPVTAGEKWVATKWMREGVFI